MNRHYARLYLFVAITVLLVSSCDRFSDIFLQDLYSAVEAVQVNGDGLIAVGDFTTVDDMAHQNIVRLDSSGSLDSDFVCEVTGGVVYSITLVSTDDETNAVIGGTFSAVNGVPRTGLAMIRLDGALVGTFAPDLAPSGAGLSVNKVLATADGSVLVGGGFASVGGNTAYANLVEIDLETGAPRAGYVPQPNGEVFDITPGLDDSLPSRHVVVGSFTQIGGEASDFAASVDRNGSVVTTLSNGGSLVSPFPTIARNSEAGTYMVGWKLDTDPEFFREVGERIELIAADTYGYRFDITRSTPTPNDEVYAVAPLRDGGYIAGGAFTTVTVDATSVWPQEYLFAASGSGSFISSYTPLVNGPVYAVHSTGSFVYVAGSFTTYDSFLGGGLISSSIIRLTGDLEVDDGFVVSVAGSSGTPIIHDIVSVADFE